jgi:CheY-like chemotaxis protein
MSKNDPDHDGGRGLIIDPNPTSRSILCAQLRDLGMESVLQCGRVADARRHLETRDFDVVLCEMDFPAGSPSGRELLEDLRRQQLLPLSTVFVMVTGEASYARVAEAAEAALDSYLLKPFTTTALAERLTQARSRKRTLAEIFAAIEKDEHERAAELCVAHFRARRRYWLYAARIGAELLLRLKRHAEAKELFEAVTEAQALPWARLGIARAQIEGNEGAPAMRTLESLIADEPTYADAFDVMGRLHVEQGQLSQALATYRQAAELTPGSLGRQQKLGMLAFYAGDTAEAARALERAAVLGQNSRSFDFQSLVLLAFARFHAKDSKGLTRCATDLAAALEKAPQSARLARFGAVVQTLRLMQQSQVGAVVAEVKRMAREIGATAFDVEAACNLLALFAQLTAAELNLPDVDGWVDAIALRFCTSRGVSELLGQTASRHPPFRERVRHCQHQVNERVAACMNHTLEGQPQLAVTSLLAEAERSRNLKFIDTARGVLQRYAGKIDDAAALDERVTREREQLAPSARLPAMGHANGRPSGGLSMARNRTADQEEAEAPAGAG